MSFYTNFALLIFTGVLINYINHRFLRIQAIIATTLISLLIGFFLLINKKYGFYLPLDKEIIHFLDQINFHDLVMDLFLGLLLFAAALNINILRIKIQKWEIAVLAIISTAISTFSVGIAFYYLLKLFAIDIPFSIALLFGALISPTDPITVLNIFKKSKKSKKLAHLLAAESLFNDGVGIVLFTLFYSISFENVNLEITSTIWLFIKEIIGGIIFGIISGFIARNIIKSIEDHNCLILFTLGIACGTYSIAQLLHISAPLAIVICGLIIASLKKTTLVTITKGKILTNFWEILDELLNAILLLLIGFHCLIIDIEKIHLIIAPVVIIITIVIRYFATAIPLNLIRYRKRYPAHTTSVITWGGLKGALAIALSLTIPKGDISAIILPITYIIVIFAILVQGTTIKILINRNLD